MSSFQEMMQGLQMLQQGVSQAATGYAINQSQKAVADINAGITDEGEKRQALQGLANNLALRLTATGASGTQIQSAFNAIDPQKFGSIEQLGIEAGLQNNQGLKDMERKLQKTNYKDWRQKGQQQHDWDMEKLREQESVKLMMAMSKGEKQTPMHGDLLKTVQDAKGGYEGVLQARQQFDQMFDNAAFARTGFWGSTAGTMNSVMASLGKQGLVDDITMRAKLKEMTIDLRKKVQKATTGLGMGVEEANELKDRIKDPDKVSPSEFLAGLKSLDTTLGTNYSSLIDTLEAGGQPTAGIRQMNKLMVEKYTSHRKGQTEQRSKDVQSKQEHLNKFILGE